MIRELDYYAVLQVQFGAQKDDISSAYRRLSKIYHPDINKNPDSEETMKQINIAYSVLGDEKKRAEYNRTYISVRRSRAYSANSEKDHKKAENVIDQYFRMILGGNFEKAYSFLSDFDKRYVTLESFCEWRKSVRRLFYMREFEIRSTEDAAYITLKDNLKVEARLHNISVTEKNLMSQDVETNRVQKHTILEKNEWHVLLGYRDLNEIAKVFENLSAQQEKNEMERHWEEYCADMCRELDILSLTGLLKESKRELYRYKRYNQSITVACFRLRPVAGSVKRYIDASVLETASRTISLTLRETDIPAYIGEGVFAILYIELKKRHTQNILKRMADTIEANVRQTQKTLIETMFEFKHYAGEPLDECINALVKKLSDRIF